MRSLSGLYWSDVLCVLFLKFCDSYDFNAPFCFLQNGNDIFSNYCSAQTRVATWDTVSVLPNQALGGLLKQSEHRDEKDADGDSAIVLQESPVQTPNQHQQHQANHPHTDDETYYYDTAATLRPQRRKSSHNILGDEEEVSHRGKMIANLPVTTEITKQLAEQRGLIRKKSFILAQRKASVDWAEDLPLPPPDMTEGLHQEVSLQEISYQNVRSEPLYNEPRSPSLSRVSISSPVPCSNYATLRHGSVPGSPRVSRPKSASQAVASPVVPQVVPPVPHTTRDSSHNIGTPTPQTIPEPPASFVSTPPVGRPLIPPQPVGPLPPIPFSQNSLSQSVPPPHPSTTCPPQPLYNEPHYNTVAQVKQQPNPGYAETNISYEQSRNYASPLYNTSQNGYSIPMSPQLPRSTNHSSPQHHMYHSSPQSSPQHQRPVYAMPQQVLPPQQQQQQLLSPQTLRRHTPLSSGGSHQRSMSLCSDEILNSPGSPKPRLPPAPPRRSQTTRLSSGEAHSIGREGSVPPPATHNESIYCRNRSASVGDGLTDPSDLPPPPAELLEGLPSQTPPPQGRPPMPPTRRSFDVNIAPHPHSTSYT